jgi:hypothetical protein
MEVVVPTTTFGRFMIMGLLSLVVSLLGGCGITQPVDRDGQPLTAAAMTGQPEGVGLDFLITRETGAQWSVKRTCLPDGQVVYIMESADFQRVPQFIVDNMDAQTRGQFFRDLANLGYTWMSAGAGSYYFGLTKPRTAHDLDVDGRWHEEWNGTLEKTIRRDYEIPDPT